MYEVGSYIVYGRSGVCRVEAVGEPNLSGFDSSKLYYTLAPVYGSETIFIPVDTKMPIRPMLGAPEAQALIADTPALLQEYAKDLPKVEQRELANFYKGLLATGQVQDLLQLLAYIYHKRRTLEQSGKRLCQTDKLYEAKAEELLHGELAVVLGIERAQIAAQIGYKP